MKEILQKEVSQIIRDRKLLEKINELGIKTVEELCGYSRMELTNLGIENYLVNDIIIALQLNGVDLKPNHAKRNHIIAN